VLFRSCNLNYITGGGNDMQYLIRTLTDSTGHTFTHVTKARENETFTVVEAESKEEAEEKVKHKEDEQ